MARRKPFIQALSLYYDPWDKRVQKSPAATRQGFFSYDYVSALQSEKTASSPWEGMDNDKGYPVSESHSNT